MDSVMVFEVNRLKMYGKMVAWKEKKGKKLSALVWG